MAKRINIVVESCKECLYAKEYRDMGASWIGCSNIKKGWPPHISKNGILDECPLEDIDIKD